MSPIEVGKPAPDVQLLGEGDRAIPLSALWRETTSVLIFLRYFG